MMIINDVLEEIVNIHEAKSNQPLSQSERKLLKQGAIYGYEFKEYECEENETNYLKMKLGWDSVNRTLRAIIEDEDDLAKEEIINLLKECTDYYKEKVRF